MPMMSPEGLRPGDDRLEAEPADASHQLLPPARRHRSVARCDGVNERLGECTDDAGRRHRRILRWEFSVLDALVHQRLEDGGELPPAQQPRSVDVAVSRFSNESPRQISSGQSAAGERFDCGLQPLRDRTRALRNAAQKRDLLCHGVSQHLGEQLRFGREEAVDGAGRQSRCRRYGGHRGRPKATARDQLARRVDDARAPSIEPLLHVRRALILHYACVADHGEADGPLFGLASIMDIFT